MLELNNFKFISDYENCKNFRKIWLLLTLVLSKQYYALRNLEKLILNFGHSYPILCKKQNDRLHDSAVD